MSSGGADRGDGDEHGADVAVQKEPLKVLTGAPLLPAGVVPGGAAEAAAKDAQEAVFHGQGSSGGTACGGACRGSVTDCGRIHGSAWDRRAGECQKP